MSKEYGRNRRVADQVQRELAVAIQREMSDTPLKFITVSNVDVSPDLKNARVFVTSLTDSDAEKQSIIGELNGRAGHFRHLLAKKLTLRSVPRLNFVFDYSIERGSRLSALIDSVNKSGSE